MPQSSRVIVTRAACAFHSLIPCCGMGSGAAAIRTKENGAMASARRLCIRQCLLGLAPACKQLRTGPLDQFIRIADAEVISALIFVELFPRDRRGHGRAFAGA